MSTFLDENPTPALPRWQSIGIGIVVYGIGIGAIIGVQALCGHFAPEIVELEVAVGQRATAVWQWVVTFGHCPACCGSGT
jgi:hypothetical protein